MDHPARPRVAEVLVTQAGEPRRGSGYLVASGWVLTAGHVVADAEAVAVWLAAPSTLEPSMGAGVDLQRILMAMDADLALVPVSSGSAGVVEPVLLGRLDRAAVNPVRVAAAGFPRFKLRPAPGRPGVELRELHVAMGTIVAGSDAKTETLELAVEYPPPEDPQPEDHSPWAGMSGAAVWASGRLVGLVGQHHPRQGPGMLTVRPLSGLFEAVTAGALAAWHGALPQLAARAEDLSLATPPSARELTARRAQRSAAKWAPRVLVARDEDLARLAAFVGSQQRWRWIQGAPFAGKTALLAWFALHPPEGVDVAACFLRRTTGQAHADYALGVLTRQLAQLAERPDYRPTTDLVDDFTDLLEDAAGACQQRGRRLLVLVDGLDEDQTVESGLRVARWLPDGETLPDNAWLLVASRAGVPIPLPDRHPLTAHIHELSVSVAATKIQVLAEAELTEAREAGGLVYDVLGMLAAAFGGLSVSDLTELIQRHGQPTVSSVQISDMLDGSLARSVSAVAVPEELEEPVRVFAHDTLLDHARTLYTRDLPGYHALFARWAQEYQQRGWPPNTPQYLLLPYTRQLTSEALDPASTRERFQWVIETLYQIVTNPRRSTLLLERTGNPAVSNQEITTTQRLLVDAHERSGAENDSELVYRLAVLALARRPLTGTLAEVLASVSSLWAQTGRFPSALAIAAGIDDPGVRARTVADVAGRLAQAGKVEQAIQVAAGIEDPGQRAWALTEVAGRLAQAGNAEQAAGLAAQAAQTAGVIQDAKQRARALADLANRLAQAGKVEQAIQVAAGIESPWERARALAEVARRLARAGQGEQAIQVAAGIEDPKQRARALADVAGRLAQAGQGEQAIQVAAGIEDPKQRARALADVARRLAQAGQGEQAIQVAAGIEDPGQRAWALTEVAGRLAQAGNAEQAAGLAAQAAQTAAGIQNAGQRAQALADVAGRLAQAGNAEQAIQIATGIENPKQQARALADVAGRLAQAGNAEQAIQIATGIENPKQQARALVGVAGGLARAGQAAWAADLAAQAVQSPVKGRELPGKDAGRPGGHSGSGRAG